MRRRWRHNGVGVSRIPQGVAFPAILGVGPGSPSWVFSRLFQLPPRAPALSPNVPLARSRPAHISSSMGFRLTETRPPVWNRRCTGDRNKFRGDAQLFEELHLTGFGSHTIYAIHAMSLGPFSSISSSRLGGGIAVDLNHRMSPGFDTSSMHHPSLFNAIIPPSRTQ
jgi:hypothetical protein